MRCMRYCLTRRSQCSSHHGPPHLRSVTVSALAGMAQLSPPQPYWQPYLGSRAQPIRVLWSEDYQRRGPLAPDLEQYLAAHDITVDQAAFSAINNVVGAGLLAAADNFACDLLVMGAYSHSRLRQLILGGVTRHVLEHATIPLLMHR